MTEMIERIARAICAAESAPDEAWPSYQGHARAALLAVREPTSIMVEKGWCSSRESRFYVKEIFRSMISAALKCPN